MIDLRFADDLLALMKEQGVSRSELARRMGIRPSRVTAILSGANNFTTETKVRAARALGAKYHYCLAPASDQVRWQCSEAHEPSLKVAEASLLYRDKRSKTSEKRKVVR